MPTTNPAAGQGYRPSPICLDALAIAGSVACAVHCLALPALAGLLPFADSALVHGLILLTILPLAGLVWRRSGDRRVRGLLLAGAGIVLLAFAGGLLGAGAAGETLVTLAGSLALIAGHYRNRELRRAGGRGPAAPAGGRPPGCPGAPAPVHAATASPPRAGCGHGPSLSRPHARTRS